ncbi:MAG: aldehyde dehydrogenase family protein [Acidobacteria bacterium]|nr:aldehyde dehydrogenase family protein [Acidobacteriota bacterium]
MVRDADLQSLQEVRDLIDRAAQAQQKFATFSQAQVDAVLDAIAAAATAAAEELARVAVEETGFGNVKDKVTKNLFSSQDVYRAIRSMKTVGILREDRENRVLEVAEPVGLVAAIIPSTNPTSTAIYKTLISLKGRNAVILSPHPSARRCICATSDIMYRAALKVGAPEGIIGCMTQITMAATQELMRHRRVGVILATGGTGLVRAAYSSGKPAFGVGPGNVPVFIERTANVQKAVADTLTGKCFDNGTLCSAEQAILAEASVREAVLAELRAQGAYFLNPQEIETLGRLVIRPDTFTVNPKIVGRAATVIAEMAGIRVPPTTRVLVAPLTGVGREHPLSAEKLSPILAFYTVANWEEAAKLATQLLQFGGLGHTAVIHSNNEAVVREFGQRIPAYRVVVNTPAPHGSIGHSTRLFPAMTLGCGAAGGNITSDNISPLHLINLKRIAWETRPVTHATERVAAAPRAAEPAPAVAARPTQPVAAGATPPRATIARVVERFLSQKGVPQAPVSPAPVVQATPATPALSRPVAEFVSESDVRAALLRQEKIWISPRTILTPSARDLGFERNVFVETSASAGVLAGRGE